VLQVWWKSLWCVHREFSYESIGEIIVKIGPHLPKLLSNIKGYTFLRHCIQATLRHTHDQIWKFKNSRWRTAAILNIFVAMTQQPIVRFPWNFAWESSFSQNFGNGTDTPEFHRTYFVFITQFGLQRAAPFVSSPIHLLKVLNDRMSKSIYKRRFI